MDLDLTVITDSTDIVDVLRLNELIYEKLKVLKYGAINYLVVGVSHFECVTSDIVVVRLSEDEFFFTYSHYLDCDISYDAYFETCQLLNEEMQHSNNTYSIGKLVYTLTRHTLDLLLDWNIGVGKNTEFNNLVNCVDIELGYVKKL